MRLMVMRTMLEQPIIISLYCLVVQGMSEVNIIILG